MLSVPLVTQIVLEAAFALSGPFPEMTMPSSVLKP